MKRKKSRVTRDVIRWAVLWRSDNRLDGKQEYLVGDGKGLPLVFLSRSACRAYIQNHYSYIRTRPDLKVEPHGWKMPQAIKVLVSVKCHWRPA